MLPFNMFLNLTTAKSNNFKPFANLNLVITVEPLIQGFPGFRFIRSLLGNQNNLFPPTLRLLT